jgi:hypothetical protein
MSDIDPRAETPLVDWSELAVNGLLPTGTVTLLLADVEGSSASPISPPKAQVPAKPPGYSARRMPSGNASARSAIKSVPPATKPRWQDCVMR